MILLKSIAILKTFVLLILISIPLINLKAQSELVSNSASPELKTLTYDKFYQLDDSYRDRFDLSGLTFIDDKAYIISDTRWSNYIYEVKLDSAKIKIIKPINLGLIEPLDLEGLTYAFNKLYFINEIGERIYQMKVDSFDMKRLRIDLKDNLKTSLLWKTNQGLSGIAINVKDSVMYLSKDRNPRKIISIDMRFGQVLDVFNIDEVQSKSDDFGDLVFKDGYLYILEKLWSVITKIDPKTKEIVDRYSFSDMLGGTNQLYEDYLFGMAEALYISDDKIYIGLDNQGKNVSLYGRGFGMKNNKKPVILVFNRPKGF